MKQKINNYKRVNDIVYEECIGCCFTVKIDRGLDYCSINEQLDIDGIDIDRFEAYHGDCCIKGIYKRTLIGKIKKLFM